ncbi:hypothetical protein BH09VER1_BH09VER1_43310 [soil metagenome]
MKEILKANRLTLLCIARATLLALTLFTPLSILAESPVPTKAVPIPGPVRLELIKLFKKYYPNATITDLSENGLIFDCKTKIFSDPDRGPNKAGNTRQGPENGGILCHIYCSKGRPWGQVSLIQICPGQPAQNIHGYPEYRVWMVAPYSSKIDANISVSLAYPPDVNESFLNHFYSILVNFTLDPE